MRTFKKDTWTHKEYICGCQRKGVREKVREWSKVVKSWKLPFIRYQLPWQSVNLCNPFFSLIPYKLRETLLSSFLFNSLSLLWAPTPNIIYSPHHSVVCVLKGAFLVLFGSSTLTHQHTLWASKISFSATHVLSVKTNKLISIPDSPTLSETLDCGVMKWWPLQPSETEHQT